MDIIDSVKLKCNAKINLFLQIDGILNTGYHKISGVFQSVGLYDTLTITVSQNKGINISCSDKNIPTDGTNIVFKTAKKMIEYLNIGHGYNIHIDKKIPSKAGLGGGSADGAGTLVGINYLLDNPLAPKKLADLGAEIGADIPFCITGGSAIVTGIGERLKPLPNIFSNKDSFLIVKPKIDINTKEAFALYDRISEKIMRTANIDDFLCFWHKKSLPELGRQLYNVFEQVLNLDEIEKIKETMGSYGAVGAVMSGSGSSVVGLFDKPEGITKCYNYFSGVFKDTFSVKAVDKGIEIIKN